MLRENSRRERIKIYKSQRTRTSAVMSWILYMMENSTQKKISTVSLVKQDFRNRNPSWHANMGVRYLTKCQHWVKSYSQLIAANRTSIAQQGTPWWVIQSQVASPKQIYNRTTLSEVKRLYLYMNMCVCVLMERKAWHWKAVGVRHRMSHRSWRMGRNNANIVFINEILKNF